VVIVRAMLQGRVTRREQGVRVVKKRETSEMGEACVYEDDEG